MGHRPFSCGPFVASASLSCYNEWMKPDELGQPTVIVPYPGCSEDPLLQDIFVYLRPETNGVIAESTILKVVKAANKNQDAMKLIYLANIPGEFIVEHKIVEQYYALRLHYAVNGRLAFTPYMAEQFSKYFKVDFNSVPVLGGFEALDTLKMEQEELFNVWVPATDVFITNGQIVKKIGGYYVVNYDIPALLHKNSKSTDIALMIFRTSLGYGKVKELVADMHQALVAINVLGTQYDAARAFHFSKGPFEQILDGASYLYPTSGGSLRLEDLTFSCLLLQRGISRKKICDLLRNPIVRVRRPDGSIFEENIFQLTRYHDYQEAIELLDTIVEQIPMINHGPILDKLEKQ